MAKNKVFTTMAWLLAGVAAGAAVSLLYAPQSGAKTRQMIRAKGKDGYEHVSKTTKKLAEQGQDMYHRGIEWAEDTKKSVTSRVKAIAA